MAESDSDCCMMQDEESSDFCDSSENEENVVPKKKVVAKKATAKPKAIKKKTPPDDNERAVVPLKTDTAISKTKAKEKTVEELYQKKSQIEHILIRPDTYGTQFGLFATQHLHA
jgi:DNA topoisomerase II